METVQPSDTTGIATRSADSGLNSPSSPGSVLLHASLSVVAVAVVNVAVNGTKSPPIPLRSPYGLTARVGAPPQPTTLTDETWAQT